MKFILLSAAVATAALFTSCKTTAPAQPDRFAQADEDHNGELTGGEFSDYVVAQIFCSRDTNFDGLMTKAEWNPEMEAEEAKLYAQRDTNKDGVVSLEEACAFARKAGTYTGEVKNADKDGNGTVNKAEALAYYGSKEGPVR